jgi:hypothetical protein
LDTALSEDTGKVLRQRSVLVMMTKQNHNHQYI